MLPSPILMFGDVILAKKQLVKIKNKHADSEWQELSLEESGFDQIRFESGIVGFGFSEKILVLKDFNDKKATCSFILDILSTIRKDVKVIIIDSNGVIKQNTKTKKLNDSSSKFIDSIKNINGHKIVFFGYDFEEKKQGETSDYIKSCFAKNNIEIDSESINSLIKIVGNKRNLLLSEIEKLSLIAPKKINGDFILENAYPINQESILWKFSDSIDENSFLKSIKLAKEYLENGVHPNVLSEILCKKARWNLATCYLWNIGIGWGDIESTLLEMGKFPSSVSQSEKEQFKTAEKALKWLNSDMGLPESYFQALKQKGAKIKAGESIPMPFMAKKTINYVRKHIIEKNAKKHSDKELKEIVLNKALEVYFIVLDAMKNIRYGLKPEQEIYEMLRAFSNS